MQIQQKEVAAVDRNLDRGVERARTRQSEADRFCQATQYIYPTMNFFDEEVPDTVATMADQKGWQGP